MTKWEDDVKAMLSGSWRPRLVDGFSVYCHCGDGVVLMYPPQGIYALWRGVYVEVSSRVKIVARGDSPGDALSALKDAVERRGLHFNAPSAGNENE